MYHRSIERRCFYGLYHHNGTVDKEVQKFHLGQQCFASYSQGQHLWFSWPERGRQIHYHENAVGVDHSTKGSFTIDGKQFPQDRIAILKEIGSFIEAPSFYANLTGRENLDIIRRILGLPKADVEDALELVGLTEFGDRLAKQYSLGMKQRLGLAGALLGRPPILILDEPTNGLDPSGIHEIRNLVKSLPSLYDCTVLISSHMLSEIELIADDIGILNHGRLLFEGSMNDLRQYALQSGFAADNLEDVFLSMVEKDNMDRKQRAKL